MKAGNALNVIQRTTIIALSIFGALLIPSSVSAQHKHAAGKPKPVRPPAVKTEMTRMMQSPHHKLMMTYMKNMSAFAKLLRDQSALAAPLDVNVARTTVGEMRHNLDAVEALKQKHMAEMNGDMKARMTTMMEKMASEHTMISELVVQLETDVRTEVPNATQIAIHSSTLFKKLEMMPMKNRQTRPAKKMTMKM